MGYNFFEYGLFFSDGGDFEFLLDETRAMLVAAEFYDVAENVLFN